MINVRSKSPLPSQQAIFSKNDISEHDRQLLKVRAIVRWIIGRERWPTGQLRKLSKLYFRRYPVFSKAEYIQALNMANELLEGINWVDGSQRK